eukprot:EC788668.1.p1 GENE.EC788668.1~~EC788668.1.p1  ORF type:complete len:150 (+),score=41.52 EC788668.1:42-491(+)
MSSSPDAAAAAPETNYGKAIETINWLLPAEKSMSWVLFTHGTLVWWKHKDLEKGADLQSAAVEMLREYGPVYPGSSFGDFSIEELDDDRGYLVTCHRDEILTLMLNGDHGLVSAQGGGDMMTGLIGRSRRATDAEELKVVHVQDNRDVY